MSTTMLHAPVISYRGMQIITTLTVFMFLAIVAVFLRFLSRRTTRSYGIDDWLILLALIFELGLYITGMCANTGGFIGFHTSQLSPDQVTQFLRYAYFNDVFYAITLPTVKLSILFMYNRIFSSVRVFHYATIPIGLVVIGWMISTLLVQVFSCTPIRGVWDLSVHAHCIDTVKFYYGNSISNVITDVMILTLPMPFLWRLQMSPRRKFGISGIFLLGSLVCIASILRIITFAGIVDEDITSPTAQWTSVETPLAIICACLPTLPHYLKHWQRKLNPDQNKNSYGSNLLSSFSLRTGLRKKDRARNLDTDPDIELTRNAGFAEIRPSETTSTLDVRPESMGEK